MYDNMLKAIFDGKILTWEPRSTESPKSKELTEKIRAEYEYFTKEMNNTDKIRLDEYHTLLLDRDYEDYNNAMFNNFMLGISVGIEIIEHKQNALKKL